MAGQIQTLHRYRATLWPAHIEASDVQEHDDKGLLPTLQFKAPSAKAAIATARHVSGLQVLRVDRIEDADMPMVQHGWRGAYLYVDTPSTDPDHPLEREFVGHVTELRLTDEAGHTLFQALTA